MSNATSKNSGMLIRVIILSVAGLALAGGAWFYSKGRVSASREDAIKDIRGVMQELDAYRTDPAYFDQLLDHCAGKASGGGIAYEKQVLACMVERLKADGKEGHTRLSAFSASLSADNLPDEGN